jgi:hypothetical protein
VIFLKETELWPTWTSVLVLAKQLGQVNATFRIFGVEKNKRGSAWRGGDGSRPQIIWVFYYLLGYVLRRGPVAQVSPC